MCREIAQASWSFVVAGGSSATKGERERDARSVCCVHAAGCVSSEATVKYYLAATRTRGSERPESSVCSANFINKFLPRVCGVWGWPPLWSKSSAFSLLVPGGPFILISGFCWQRTLGLFEWMDKCFVDFQLFTHKRIWCQSNICGLFSRIGRQFFA